MVRVTDGDERVTEIKWESAADYDVACDGEPDNWCFGEANLRRNDAPATLTRRDKFAMAALTGLCGNCDSAGMFSWTPEGVADFANRIADLMEAARNKEGGS